MTDLEQVLRELAGSTRYPETPDVASRVVAALPARRRRRRLVVGLVVASLAAAGIAFAVPPARSAILDWLGFGSVEIQRVPTLPTVPTTTLPLGRATTLVAAARATGFRIRLLPRRVDGAYVHGSEVTLVYGTLLLGEVRGRNVVVARKVVGPGTTVEDVRVAGSPGLWLSGEPHLFAYLDAQGRFVEGRIRLAGNTLLWESDGLVLRLEGAGSKEEALRLARSVR